MRFWLIAAVVSAAAHVCFAAWVDSNAPARRTPPPPITMELAAVPKPPPPRVLPPPPPPPPPPKKAIVVKKLATKAPPPPSDPTPPPPESPLDGAQDEGGAVPIREGTPEGDPDGTPKAPPAPPAPPPPAPAKPKSQFVPIYQVTRMPTAKRAVTPEIPDAFRQANREALVVVEVELDAQGHVTGARVMRHAEFGLDDAALAAAKQTEFEPALVGTLPVPVRFQIPYRFRVRG